MKKYNFFSGFSLIFCLMLLSGIFFSSCKHKPFEILPLQSNGSTPKDIAANPNNPYDDAGKIHNEILDEIARSKSFPKVPLKEMYDISCSVMMKHNKECISYDSAAYANFVHDIINGVNTSARVESDTLLSQEAQSKMSDINNIVQNEGKDTTAASSESQYQSFHQKMVSLENNITSSNTLTNYDKEKLLGTASTARYSRDYWQNQVLNDNANPWHEPMVESLVNGRLQSVQMAKWKKWLLRIVIVAAADTAGYFGCMYIGSAVTPIVPGPIGAAIASALAAIIAANL